MMGGGFQDRQNPDEIPIVSFGRQWQGDSRLVLCTRDVRGCYVHTRLAGIGITRGDCSATRMAGRANAVWALREPKKTGAVWSSTNSPQSGCWKVLGTRQGTTLDH